MPVITQGSGLGPVSYVSVYCLWPTCGVFIQYTPEVCRWYLYL